MIAHKLLFAGAKVASLRKPKYRNTPTVVDGVRFASKREARRDGELHLLQRAGEINGLERQPRFPLKVNDQLVATYIADWSYMTKAGVRVVEDAKGVRTPVYQIKRKLMKAIFNVEVVET